MIKLNKRNNKAGFTIVELLVVISIMSILASVTVFGYENLSKRTAISNDKALVNQINRVLEAYSIYEHDEEKISNALVEEFGKEILVESYEFGYDLYLNIDLCEFDLLKQSIYENDESYINIRYYLNLDIENSYTPENDHNSTNEVFNYYTIDESKILTREMSVNLENKITTPYKFEISNYSNIECTVIRVVSYNNYEFTQNFEFVGNYIYFYRPGIYKLTYTVDGKSEYKVVCIQNTYISNILSTKIDANSVNHDVIWDNSNLKVIISNYLPNIVVTEYNQNDCKEETISLYYDKSLIPNIDIIINANNTYKYTTMNPNSPPEYNYEFIFNDININNSNPIEITYRYFGLDGCWHYYNHIITIN